MEQAKEDLRKETIRSIVKEEMTEWTKAKVLGKSVDAYRGTIKAFSYQDGLYVQVRGNTASQGGCVYLSNIEEIRDLSDLLIETIENYEYMNDQYQEIIKRVDANE